MVQQLMGEGWWPEIRWLILTVGAMVAVVLIAYLTMGRDKAQAGGAGGTGKGAAGAGGPPSMTPMPVDVDTARVRPIIDAVRATGRIEAVQAVQLRSDEQGRVTAILFQEGQVVPRGASLVRIDDAMLRAQIGRAH